MRTTGRRGHLHPATQGGKLHARIALQFGRLRLKTLALVFAGDHPPEGAVVERPTGRIAAEVSTEGRRVRLTMAQGLVLEAGDTLKPTIE